MQNGSLVATRNLRKYYKIERGFGRKTIIRAVDGVNLSILKGEILGLLGESGSGKTTLGKILVGIERPDEGTVQVNGQDLHSFIEKNRSKIQMVFQNPDTSLNPRMTVYEILSEAIEAGGEEPSLEKTIELLNNVGLDRKLLDRYPAHLSGGQKQRVAIARVLALKPEFVVGDEIVSALDATVKAQILSLLQKLQRELGFSVLFISHDLAVTRHVSNRIAVMYGGKVVEEANSELIVSEPKHPYTQHLLSSLPSLYLQGLKSIPQNLSKLNRLSTDLEPPQTGCKLSHICPFAREICRREEPPEIFIEKNHRVFCHIYNKS